MPHFRKESDSANESIPNIRINQQNSSDVSRNKAMIKARITQILNCVSYDTLIGLKNGLDD